MVRQRMHGRVQSQVWPRCHWSENLWRERRSVSCGLPGDQIQECLILSLVLGNRTSKKPTVVSSILGQQLWLLWEEQGAEKIAVTSGLKCLFHLRSGNTVEWTEIWVGLVWVFVLFLQALSWSSGSGRLREEAVAEVNICYQFRAPAGSDSQRAKERKKMRVLWMRTK